MAFQNIPGLWGVSDCTPATGVCARICLTEGLWGRVGGVVGEMGTATPRGARRKCHASLGASPCPQGPALLLAGGDGHCQDLAGWRPLRCSSVAS